MERLNANKKVSKGVRLKWASLKDVTSVRLCAESIQGTRASETNKYVLRDSGSGQLAQKSTKREHDNNSHKNYLIP